jgi:hypothetical protein
MYSVRCPGASALNTGRVSPADRAHQVARRPPAAQATPVGPNRQRPLPGSRQLVQASSRSRQRFRHAVAARQGSRPPRSSHGDRVVCRRRPRRWSRPYQSIWPVPRGSFYEPAAVHRRLWHAPWRFDRRTVRAPNEPSACATAQVRSSLCVARLFGQRSLRGLPVPQPGGLGLCPRRCQT